MHIVRDYFANEFADFLIQEGNYYQSEYQDRRSTSCAYSGQPITQKHLAEFEAAKEVGSLLLKAAEIIKQFHILN
jgi:hypothetical protein